MENIKVNIGGVNLEMDKEIISKAVEKGELVINDNDLVIYKKDEFDELTKNIANDEYVKGRIDGVEIFGKQVKKEGGFDIENPKVFLNVKGNVDFEKTASEFISKIKPIFETKLNIEPSKKITELQNDLEKIQNNYKQLEDEYVGFKTSIQQKDLQQKKDNSLLRYISKHELIVEPDIALIAVRNKYGVDIDFDDEGNEFLTERGKIVKNEKTLSPIKPDDYIASLITPLIKKEAVTGRGSKDDYGTKTETDYDKFVKEMEQNNISQGSLAFSEEQTKRLQNGTLKI
jgi:hypothetical protein